ncbi:hybrid sensor histidine kinase/response regulator [Methanosphaerula palustris]|uniref:histidine kinase n=1 Tax=Methanosphaerula palustris (strain ATCC BAA-1556 / DSM 19958 / E1-9c) TaxID=521011 RepID=B8GIZ0_METPE|nr:PAS domain S-box protein [Methanosphaerula palustris]ACL15563.1 multi-sensor signal transduction histidine kinase [Methanosphaerula palustris E1-9c]
MLSVMAAEIRVLYVDDEPGLLEIGKLFLERERGFVVDTLTSARVALEQLNSERYDVIISDYQMPEMNGIQFLVEVRRRFEQIPFILFTGKGREEVVIQAINCGGDFYIQKGGEPGAQYAELANKIKQATSRKKSVDSFRENEDDYRYLIEHSNESIVVVQDDMLRQVNHRIVERTGYSEQELLSIPFFALIHPDDRAMTVERFHKRMMGEETPSKYSFRLTGKDGSTIWNEISAVTITWEGRPATMNFLIDITGRKQTEEALRNSEVRLHTLVDTIPDLIWLKDTKGAYLSCNPMFERFFGANESEIVGKTDYDFLDRKLADSFHEQDLKAMVSGRPIRNEDWITFADEGHCALMDTIKTPMYNDQGALIGVLSIGRDISERKRAEDAIELANKKLNLMNNITRHDILNTITGLLGCVDMANVTDSEDERRQLFQDIKNLTKSIQRQIAFTKEYQEVGVNLPAWQNVEDLLQRILINFKQSGKQFIIDLESVEIYADPLLEKVFHNLVDNAIRYGKNLTTIKFFLVKSNNGLSLICEDDGPGIPDDIKCYIFEHGVGNNSGMGLFLSREILGITNIGFWEDGIYGKGARFEMFIPHGTYRFIA